MKRLRKELRKVQLSSSDKEQSMSEESHKGGDKGAEIGAENIERRGARLEGEERQIFLFTLQFCCAEILCTEGPEG